MNAVLTSDDEWCRTSEKTFDNVHRTSGGKSWPRAIKVELRSRDIVISGRQFPNDPVFGAKNLHVRTFLCQALTVRAQCTIACAINRLIAHGYVIALRSIHAILAPKRSSEELVEPVECENAFGAKIAGDGNKIINDYITRCDVTCVAFYFLYTVQVVVR